MFSSRFINFWYPNFWGYFPFDYGGNNHYECITHDNDGTPWCDVGDGKKDNCTTDCPRKLVLISQCDYK